MDPNRALYDVTNNVHRPLFLSLTQIRSNAHFVACVIDFVVIVVVAILVGVGAVAEEAEVDQRTR
jgi:NADH:ubiquinone oxidoreductase subunit 6 (subunit J)